MTTLTREVIFEPAFDKRDPNPSKNYGIRGVTIRFLLRGDGRLVQLVLDSGWYLSHVQEEYKNRRPRFLYPVLPASLELSYHSRVPLNLEDVCAPCTFLGSECFSRGSFLGGGESIRNILLSEGSDGVWRELEKYYKETSGEEE